MAERHPGWVNGIDAFEARLATGLSLAAEGSGDALDPIRVRAGIRDAPGFPGRVTLGANSVTVNPFQAVIRHETNPGAGAYLVTLDAAKELPLGAADQTRSRIDLVVAEVVPGSGVGFEVRIAQGTPADNPVPPSITGPHLVLAEIRVPFVTAVPNTPVLTRRSKFTAALGGILPVWSAADRPANAAHSTFVYRLDTRVLEVQTESGWVPYRPPRGDTWQTPTLQNGWVNYGGEFNPAGYTLTDDGWVRLRGLVKNGQLDRPIFTLRVGYRPTAQQLLGVTTAPDAHGRVDVLPDGRVIASTGNPAWLSLDGLSFATY